MSLGANCKACNKASPGFAVMGEGSRLEAGSGCLSEGIKQSWLALLGQHGYMACDKGYMSLGANCKACNKASPGFAVMGEGSRLEAGSGCLSEGSDKIGNAGYVARDKGYMSLGANCEVRNNGGGKNVPKFLVDTTGSTISRPEGVTLGGWPRR
mmetsp:Transcript_27168/g.59320  ORF Transcript_27168/g.59320 Transcript_27168/m.59320 type:complete len:154 (+) Transcript_27168:3-464(+)